MTYQAVDILDSPNTGRVKWNANDTELYARDATFTVASQAAMLATGAKKGDVAKRTDTDPDSSWRLVVEPATSLGNWLQISGFGGAAASAASEGAAGVAEIATQAETNTGTDDERFVTPAKLNNSTSLDDRYIRTVNTTGPDGSGNVTVEGGGGGGWTAVDASETVKGIAELSTQAETNTGTDDARIVTPLKLASYTGITNKALASDLTAHTGDTSDAHDASAISYAGGTGMAATEVEAAIDELATEKANASALTDHIDDTADAHDATAISFTPAGTIAATTVQAAIEEAASESGGGSGYRTLVELGSDVAGTANAWANVTGLSFAVTSGVVYRFHALIIYTVNATTTGSAWAISGPASPTLLAYCSTYPSGPGTNTVGNLVAYDAASLAATSADIAGNRASIEGLIKPSASGTVIVRCFTENGGTLSIKAGSTLEYW